MSDENNWNDQNTQNMDNVRQSLSKSLFVYRYALDLYRKKYNDYLIASFVFASL